VGTFAAPGRSEVGFEAVINNLRVASDLSEENETELRLFERMLVDMFNAMNLGFKGIVQSALDKEPAGASS
jgi:hypothetical protein